MVVLLAQNQFPTNQVAEALRSEGVGATHFQWEQTLRELSLPGDLNKAVLIASEPDIIWIGDRTREARSLMSDQAHLLVCTPSLNEGERLAVKESGADTILIPRTYAVKHVSERITGELILQGNGQLTSFGQLHGATKQMRTLYSQIEALADLNEPVLILGETGTGKELIAREIHRHSKRPEPFLDLNCAELSPELLRAELFGHTKGAFTGAHQDKNGLMTDAGAGTLFLDEIGELDQHSQAMLLKVIEYRQFRAVGSNKQRDFNARLVLATHRNLDQMVEQGKFRQDLLRRINGFPLLAPPLRERKADIPTLAHHLLEQFNHEYPTRAAKIPPGALDCLFHSEWPGNVRQLRNLIRNAAAFKDSEGNLNTSILLNEALIISPPGERISTNSTSFDPASEKLHDVTRRITKDYLAAVLTHTGGNKEAAYKISGLGRSRFYDLLRELEIK